MKPRSKQNILDLLYLLGMVMPKAVCFGYYVFFAYAWYYVVDWFMVYDFTKITEPTVALAIAGFPAAILAVLTKLIQPLTEMAFKQIKKNGYGEGNGH